MICHLDFPLLTWRVLSVPYSSKWSWVTAYCRCPCCCPRKHHVFQNVGTCHWDEVRYTVPIHTHPWDHDDWNLTDFLYVTDQLLKAVSRAQYPSEPTIIQRFVPPVSNLATFHRDGMRPMENRRICLQCFEAFRQFVVSLIESLNIPVLLGVWRNLDIELKLV